ncbi:MAG: right-handed parallel beta-helix repeat-containing protein [Candidatus Hydrogenedentes bacterium]|nr:right-handed parallel beta-helix repeat-containing protein [Candidatus Hydrogenedentota bacterium]
MTSGWSCAIIVCVAGLLAAPETNAAPNSSGARIYVSTEGKDAWSGRLPVPDPAKTDGPFATLERARDEIRKLKQAGPLPAPGVTVVIRSGAYYLGKPFELSADDSGTETAPITYTAFPGEEVRLSAAKPVAGFQAITDPEVLQRLDEQSRAHVLQADLKSQGIADPGAPNEGGAEVFFDDMPMTLSRWPNEGFARIADIVVQDGLVSHGIKGSKVGKFKYDGDRPSRWLHEKDPWLYGCWFWDWSDERQKIASIDTGAATITLAPPAHGYGYRKGQWYYAFNMLSELDSPGEWYIDREKGILYFWPPHPINTAKTAVTILPNVVVMKETSFVTLQGFTIEGARGDALIVSGGKGVQAASCVIRNIGGTGAQMSGAGHRFHDCEVYQTGAGGVALSGGDRVTLTPGGLSAENNHFHNYGRVKPMYTPAISLNGVGNLAAHNLIHDAPHAAILFGGNDHVMEFNEIHHVCQQSNDAGAIYTGCNWTMRGNQIRYNYLHDITGFEDKGCVGVYLDDMFSSAAIYGNVFYNVVSAAFIGGGRDCSIENNIFVDCKPAVHVDARALGWAAGTADDWLKEAKDKGTISGIAYNKPPYSDRYPKLITILDNNPKAPVGNVIARNICWGGKWDDIEQAARPLLTFESNLLDQDPLFVDAEKHDYHLKKESPAFKLKFKEIPIDQVGIRTPPAQSKAAQNERERIIGAPELSATQQVSAWLNLARKSLEHNDWPLAAAFTKKALGVKGASAEDKARAHLERGQAHAVARQFGDARKGFAKAARMSQPSRPIRSLAELQLARMSVEENKIAGAKANYTRVSRSEAAPPQHRAEADEALKSLERAKQGLSPRDPNESRCPVKKRPEPGLRLYVATDGSDANPGTQEKPFATIQRAVDAIATTAKNSGLPNGGVSVSVRGGVYRLQHGITVSRAASGAEGKPVVFGAAEGADVRINGSAPVKGFQPVKDPAVLSRLPEAACGKVVVVDLKAQGITHFAPLVYRGYSCGAQSSTELFVNGKPMTPARWPNTGFLRTGKVIDAGSQKENRGGIFEFKDERAKRWSNARDMWLYGYWFYDWADNTIGVAALDTASGQVRTTNSTTYGIKEGQPFYVFNLLEEIDTPGEWYLDRESGRLYLYPIPGLESAAVEISLLEEPLIRIDGASHVTLQGLTLEYGAGDGVKVEGGENCLVAGCVVRRLGGTGVSINGGHACGVLSCDLYALGRRGTEIIGGDRKTLTPGNNFVENCDIFDFSRVDRTYTPAVQIEGVGNRIAHNNFHDSPAHAMRLEGNDHVVEYNNVHDVVRETDDQGGIDLWANPSYRGNILRYNFWHDIGNDRACGQAGIRLDDAISGTLIYGNVFYRCSEQNFGGVQIHGGKDNWVDNNIFAECKYGISFTPWGKERWEKFLASDWIASLLTKDVDIASPPYSTRYPALQHLHEGIDVNMVWRNIVYNCGDFLNRTQPAQNLLDNYVTRQDPGFVDAAKQNFELKDDAPVLNAIGFHPIPFGEIGLYDDALRAKLKTIEQ